MVSEHFLGIGQGQNWAGKARRRSREPELLWQSKRNAHGERHHSIGQFGPIVAKIARPGIDLISESLSGNATATFYTFKLDHIIRNPLRRAENLQSRTLYPCPISAYQRCMWAQGPLLVLCPDKNRIRRWVYLVGSDKTNLADAWTQFSFCVGGS